MSAFSLDRSKLRYALSPAQMDIWLEQSIFPQSAQFIISPSYVIPLELEVDRFLAAVNWVFSHYQALFARLVRGPEDVPELIFDPANAPRCEYRDISSEIDPAEALQKLLDHESHRPFQMLDTCLSRPVLVKTGTSLFCYYCNYHHIVIDGWGVGIVFQRITQAYDSLRKGLELEVEGDNYIEFLEECQKPLQPGEHEKAEIFWKPLLAAPIPSIPISHAEYENPGQHACSNARTILSRELANRVAGIAAVANATLSHAVMLACGYLIARQHSLDCFVAILPILNRSKKYKETMGFFVEVRTTPLPIDKHAPVIHNLTAIARRLRGLFRHYHLSAKELKQLYQSLGHIGAPNRHGTISYVTRDFDASIDGVPIRMADVPVGHENSPFTLYIYDTYPDLDIRLELAYQHRFMNQDEAELFLSRIAHLLDEFCLHPQSKLHDLNIVPPAERRRIDSILCQDGDSITAQRLVLDDILERARLNPDAIAVETAGSSHSYRECVEKAHALAKSLVHDHQVCPGDRVALLLPREAGLISSYLAVMMTGGALVPLEPSYPEFRIRQICEDARVRCLITNASLSSKGRLVNVPVLRTDLCSAGPEPFLSRANQEQTAYIIYTSGSTGQPKGVVISQRSLMDHLANWFKVMPLRERSERVVYFHSPAFDATIETVFGSLIRGDTLVMAPHPQWTAYEFARVAVERRLTVLNCPPAYLLEFLKYVQTRPGELEGHQVHFCLCGGEVMHAEIAPLWDAVFGSTAMLICIYGPTETTVTASSFKMPPGYRAEPGESLPIGRIHPGRTARILDEWNRDVPVGNEGELLIGGIGVAQGYQNLPQETAASFVTLDDGKRYYRSGDIVRLKSNGLLQFQRRRDQQVKIRGFRVELAEIEACLLAHRAVRECAVLACQGAEATDVSLRAFLALFDGASVNSQSLREHLAARLPHYMIPKIVILPVLPKTSSGKIDRLALQSTNIAAEPVQTEVPAEFFPQGPVQEYLVFLWQQALGGTRCDARSDFFALGGHSLLAAKLVAKIGKSFRVDFPFSAFFEKPTILDTERTLEQLVGNRAALEKMAQVRLELAKMSPEEIQARLQKASFASP